MGAFADIISNVNFYDLHRSLVQGGYFDFIFPFLLVYALFFTALQQVSLFKSKDGVVYKPVIVIISLVLSFFGVGFEISPGKTVGFLLQSLFPNIGALTIGVLMLYIVGSILGVDFFKGVFRKDYNAYLFFTVGAFGFGAIVFYVGIAMGLWDFNVFDQLAYWNTIFTIGFFILGIVLVIAKLPQFGAIFIVVAGFYLSGPKDVSIFRYFLDPFVFIFILFIFFFAWASGSDREEKIALAKKLKEGEESIESFKKLYNGKPKDYESRVFDVVDQSYSDNLKRWKEKYGDEDYKKYV
jgi:hypothetical protein